MHPNDGRVVSNFIVQALKRERHHNLTATARQTRSFCYVDDLIEGFVALMASPSADDRARSTSAIRASSPCASSLNW